jgi:hypothetical protein
MSITRGYRNQAPYAILMSGRPDESASHKAIAVYSREEYEEYKKKGWVRDREFTERWRRATEHPKGYWT